MLDLKGKAISFEGGEGVGKTTVIDILMKDLKNEQNIDSVKIREPGGTDICEQIREVILTKKNTKMFGITEALLLAASRAQLLREKTMNLLDEGNFVIYDRFVDSSYVYQGGVRGLGIDEIIKLNEFAIGDFRPLRTYVLDLDPKIGLARIHSNDRETNRLDDEGMEFHYNVRKYYLEIAKRFPERICVINADQIPEKIVADIKKDLYNL